MEKFKEDLKNAIKHLKIADHMTYVTLPLVNEHKLLLKIFDEIAKSIISLINSILNYEYLYKRISLYRNNKDNLNTFIHRCAKNYDLNNEQIRKIKEILELHKKYKASAMEFVKNNKVVILYDSLKTEILDIDIIKQYLALTKDILIKIKKKINLEI